MLLHLNEVFGQLSTFVRSAFPFLCMMFCLLSLATWFGGCQDASRWQTVVVSDGLDPAVEIDYSMLKKHLDMGRRGLNKALRVLTSEEALEYGQAYTMCAVASSFYCMYARYPDEAHNELEAISSCFREALRRDRTRQAAALTVLFYEMPRKEDVPEEVLALTRSEDEYVARFSRAICWQRTAEDLALDRLDVHGSVDGGTYLDTVIQYLHEAQALRKKLGGDTMDIDGGEWDIHRWELIREYRQTLAELKGAAKNP